MTRGTIKLPEDEFERHNERRKELGQTWAEYLDGQAPDHQERMLEVQERQADALETIAGALLLEYDSRDDRPDYNPEALLKEARFHYDPERLDL